MTTTLWTHTSSHHTSNDTDRQQGRSNGGWVYRYIYPPKSVYLTNFYVVTGSFFLFDPGHIRYRDSVRLSSCFLYLLIHHNLYPPSNEIPGYAPDRQTDRQIATDAGSQWPAAGCCCAQILLTERRDLRVVHQSAVRTSRTHLPNWSRDTYTNYPDAEPDVLTRSES